MGHQDPKGFWSTQLKIDRYIQIVKTLTAEIEAGKYPVGELFPKRSELAERFKVTKATVNRAAEILVKQKLIVAKRGAGSVVVNNSPSHNIAYVAPDWLMRHIPAATGYSTQRLSYEEALGKGAHLSRFDGVLWSHPGDEVIPRIIEIQKDLPGIIINRAVPETNFVATDLHSKFAELVAERLALLPDSIPHMLCGQQYSPYVHGERHEGFIRACRDARRFYEIVPIRDDFNDRIADLEKRVIRSGSAPLLIFAEDWALTGAVVKWVSRHGFRWQKDIFYTDFDNLAHTHVWGVTTTSVIQDFDLLSRKGLELLQAIIRDPLSRQQLLLEPVIRRGDT